MIWDDGLKHIYDQESRKKWATKNAGLDRTYTAEEMRKKLLDLCSDFNTNLDEYDNVIPSNQTLLCDDF